MPTPMVPDPASMLEHLQYLFGGHLDGHHEGLIELAWNEPSDRAVRHAQLYKTDQLELLVQHAVNRNSREGCNVYIGAALRKPGTAPFTRAKDEDFLCLTCAYVDLDEPGTVMAAKAVYGKTLPNLVVLTGQTPSPRAQLWWRLDEPIVDPLLSQSLLKGMAAAMDGDSTVTNPCRVMRLAGSVAWPVKPGRVQELTELFILQKHKIDWGHLARTFPSDPLTVGGINRKPTPAWEEAENGPGIKRAPDAFGMATGKVEDGREAYMLATLNACLIQLIGENPSRAPTPQELFDLAWPQFSAGADISKPRSTGQPWTPEAFLQKAAYTIERFSAGDIAGCRSMEEAVAAYQVKQLSGPAIPGFTGPRATQPAGDPYELLDVAQIKALDDPRWLVDGMVVEEALGFIYGPPGCLKTFIALDLSLSFACGQTTWWGRGVHHKGAVIYITTEGVLSFKYRIMAWEQHRGVVADAAPFRMMRQSINFMQKGDIERLLATVQYAVEQWGPVAAVIVDTVSRVLPGSDENLQKDMTVFVAACDAVRQRFRTTVIGLHHSAKAGSMRGSTVLGAAGDFVLAVHREPGAMVGEIYAEKIKDAEDGWTRPFKVTKIALGTLGERSSLVLDGTDPIADDGNDDNWPSREVCKQILAAIDEQWQQGKPWCWSSNSPRCAAKNIVNRWDHIRLSVAEDILNKWHARGVICEEVRDAKNHVKGYRKLVDL